MCTTEIDGVLGKVDDGVSFEVVYEAVHVVGRPNRPNYIANFAENFFGTISIVNFAENDAKRFAVTPLD